MNYESRIMNYALKKILPLLILVIIIMPVLVWAQNGLIPCDGSADSPCDFDALMKLVSNIIDWIIRISIPVAAGVFAWAGILYMTTGIAGKKEEAKTMLWKVFWGLVIILSAWLIVTTLTDALLSDGSNNDGTNFKEAVPIEGVQ